MRVGITVECKTCRRGKAPRGRSISAYTWNSYCTDDQCNDYYNDPKPGDLWNGETEEDWGYAFSLNATRELTEEELKSRRDRDAD